MTADKLEVCKLAEANVLKIGDHSGISTLKSVLNDIMRAENKLKILKLKK